MRYLNNAAGERPIRSSIPTAISAAAEQAALAQQQAQRSANEVRTIRRIAVLAALGIVIAVAATTISIFALIQDATSYVRSAQTELQQERTNYYELLLKLDEQADQINAMSTRNAPLSEAIQVTLSADDSVDATLEPSD